MTRPIETLAPTQEPNQDVRNHEGRFIAALTLSAAATAVTCVYPPAVIAAIPTYGWALYEARHIPILNSQHQ